MSYGKPEQIDEIVNPVQKCIRKRFIKPFTTSTPGYRKMLKKTATRRRRMMEKCLLDETPIKNEYCGWSL